jgi:hypothetical protein
MPPTRARRQAFSVLGEVRHRHQMLGKSLAGKVGSFIVKPKSSAVNSALKCSTNRVPLRRCNSSAREGRGRSEPRCPLTRLFVS